MSQNRGLTRGLVAVERILIQMIHTNIAKKSGPCDCVVIRRLSQLGGCIVLSIDKETKIGTI